MERTTKNPKYRSFLPIIIWVMLLCAGVLLISPTAFATSSNAPAAVTYNAASNQFTFANATPPSGYTNPDLFQNFKSLVPGDSILQTVTITTENLAANETANITLQAENENQDYTTFTALEDLQFMVKNSSGQEITTAITTPLLLGSFTGDETETVTIALFAPLTAGNKFADLEGNIDWVFTAEVITEPDEEEDDDLIQTGQLRWPIALLVGVGAILIGIGVYLTRKKHPHV